MSKRNDFYSSKKWQSARYDALSLNDGCCSLCGRSRREHKIILHVDHIKPKSQYPELALTISNLQVICEDCNIGKSNKDCIDWQGNEPAEDIAVVEYK